ncbi:MAG: HU family DNA-binding protein [Acidobacteria bacterium]|nr:HU family DNA-binding protein [Acidobacteriota bacterium]
MTKKELIQQVSLKTGFSEALVMKALASVLNSWTEALVAGDSIRLHDFGSFSSPLLSHQAEESKNTLPRQLVRFRPSGKLSRLIAGTQEVKETIIENINESTGGHMTDMPNSESHNPGQEADFFGLDVGTSRIVLASGEFNNVKTQTQLNAFVTVPYSKFTENILRQNKITYQMSGKEILIFGNESEKFANSFNVEARRPMYNGLLNPSEVNGWQIIQSIIELLVKKTKGPDILCFSVPGAPRGGEANLVYHEGMLKNFLEALGYRAKSVNEGLSVVFAEMEKDNFTGIGISCGGGMCNVCFAFMSVPVFSFSISKAGDYIDNAVAAVTSEVATRIRVIKEDSLDLSRNPKDKYESAMHIYYEEMILTLVETLRTEISESRNLPRLDRAIPIVLSGGTAKPKGFLEKFEKIFRQNDFPIKISEVRMASEPLTATARGCYIAAAYES